MSMTDQKDDCAVSLESAAVDAGDAVSTGGFSRTGVDKILAAVLAEELAHLLSVAAGCSGAFWAGFHQAMQELAQRLGMPLPESDVREGEARALRAETEYNIDALERLSHEAENKGHVRIARTYRQAARTMRRLVYARWGVTFEATPYTFMRRDETGWLH
jgi:hypothetical protein